MRASGRFGSGYPVASRSPPAGCLAHPGIGYEAAGKELAYGARYRPRRRAEELGGCLAGFVELAAIAAEAVDPRVYEQRHPREPVVAPHEAVRDHELVLS